MSSPIQFYRSFREILAGQGIRHALTSGMACVEYGIQQTTKDTDWVIDPRDLAALVSLLEELEAGLSGRNWRVSYRPLFGAPLQKEYLENGWTSHLAIHDSADSPEHHLDFFGKPPRISTEGALSDSKEGIASRLVVAQMKKTDRDKDWPSVEALSLQAVRTDRFGALLHLRDPDVLNESWKAIEEEQKARLIGKRPLLTELQEPVHGLSRCLAVERAVWEETNKLRYRAFQHEWKNFLRRWRAEEDFAWPSGGSFAEQNRIVREAVERYELPVDPLGGPKGRALLYSVARKVVMNIFAASDDLMDAVSPPIQEILA